MSEVNSLLENIMEAGGTSQTHSKLDTIEMDGRQEEPPTSMNLVSYENFSQVIFTNIQKSYPPKTDIQCNFHRRTDFQSGTKDWVGIFRVGWQTTKEYYTWISASSSVENQILFKAYYLPKDDEYYQFCYVDQNGEVRGISTPFQVTEDEDEKDDMVVVTTQEEMETMNQENRILKEKNNSMSEVIRTLQAELHEATEKSNTLEKKNMEKNNSMSEVIRTLQAELHEATEKSNTLEKENMMMRSQVKNLEDENEMVRRTNLESELQECRAQDLETELQQKIMDLEKAEAENKRLQSGTEAEQQAVRNLTALLDNCKEEVTRLKDKLEVQARALETEKRQKEELKRSLEEEKMKALDLENNFKKTNSTFRKEKEKLQQQLDLQQKKDATKDEEIKQLRSQIDHLNANTSKREDSCKEHLKIIEKEIADLKELLRRQSKDFLDSENKIKELRTKLRSSEERGHMMEEELAKKEAEMTNNEDLIAALRNAVDLRTEEVTDLKESCLKRQEENNELNMLIIQERYAAPTFPASSSTSQDMGLAYGNPYQENPSRHISENESLEHVQTRSDQEETQSPGLLTCELCSKTFPRDNGQVYADHVMCHSFEIYDN